MLWEMWFSLALAQKSKNQKKIRKSKLPTFLIFDTAIFPVYQEKKKKQHLGTWILRIRLTRVFEARYKPQSMHVTSEDLSCGHLYLAPGSDNQCKMIGRERQGSIAVTFHQVDSHIDHWPRYFENHRATTPISIAIAMLWQKYALFLDGTTTYTINSYLDAAPVCIAVLLQKC